MLFTNLKNLPQTFLVFALACAGAYFFGFYAYFAHTAFEAVYWALFYLGSHLAGNVLFNFIASFSPKKEVKTVAVPITVPE